MSVKKRKKTVYVMFGCPTDAEFFLDSMNAAIDAFNSMYGDSYSVNLVGCHWKKETYSAAENTQKAINGQLCKKCEILIAVFYQSIGSSITNDEPGTIAEINYFRKEEKPAFVLRYMGKCEVDLADSEQLQQLENYILEWKKHKQRIYYKEYKDGEELKEQIILNLKLYFEELKKIRKRNSNGKQRNKQNSQNELQTAMKEHLRVCDEWNALPNNFRFSKKAEALIAGIKEDGSVQYYVGSAERYRTTPVASTLEALYTAGLIPELVCQKMQDWVYNSRKDPCDEPGEEGSNPVGHPPEPEDEPGWSWNEGVSVWATSKALDTLILTGYYDRQDIAENSEVQETTRNALEWLVDQAYESGGWGFQHMSNLDACSASVTMTALALKVITRFLKASEKIILGIRLEEKLSNAKQKGIDYLISEMQEETGNVYWKYNKSPSLTATVWVLDFINVAGTQEAGLLYKKRKQIRSFCLSKLPKTDSEYDNYIDEVYFAGGKTKYKTIAENSKFYSYMPYHIPVLLNAGVLTTQKQIKVCIRALVIGNEVYWNGTDKSQGHYQRKSCFVLAMALSVVAIWMKKITREKLSSEVSEKWDIERD